MPLAANWYTYVPVSMRAVSDCLHEFVLTKILQKGQVNLTPAVKPCNSAVFETKQYRESELRYAMLAK